MAQAALRPTLRRAPNSYYMNDENLFRRELEMILAVAIEVVGSIMDGTNSISSTTHKRGTYRPTVGVVSYGTPP
jgi:hypothetical protein